MLILLEYLLGILPLKPLFFFHHLVPHVCPRISHLKFPEHFFVTRETLKKVFD